MQGWLETKRLELKPRTHYNYVSDAERYVLPHLGAHTLAKLSLRDIKGVQTLLAREHGVYTANRVRALAPELFR